MGLKIKYGIRAPGLNDGGGYCDGPFDTLEQAKLAQPSVDGALLCELPGGNVLYIWSDDERAWRTPKRRRRQEAKKGLDISAAIEHARDVAAERAECDDDFCARDHEQLAEWLGELRDRRCEVETRKHQQRVAHFLRRFACALMERADRHDASKLGEFELPILAVANERLHGLTYGTPEYKEQIRAIDMRPFLDHHYAENDHHPQHFENGIDDMSLIQLVEMLCDWRAATERHDDGDIFESIQYNTDRFGISKQLAMMMETTMRELESGGW